MTQWNNNYAGRPEFNYLLENENPFKPGTKLIDATEFVTREDLADESAIKTHTERGITHAGWWLVLRKENANGVTYKSECLVAMSVAEGTIDSVSGDGTAASEGAELTPDHYMFTLNDGTNSATINLDIIDEEFDIPEWVSDNTFTIGASNTFTISSDNIVEPDGVSVDHIAHLWQVLVGDEWEEITGTNTGYMGLLHNHDTTSLNIFGSSTGALYENDTFTINDVTVRRVSAVGRTEKPTITVNDGIVESADADDLLIQAPITIKFTE